MALDMERSLLDSSTALVGALLATEILVHVDDAPDSGEGTSLRRKPYRHGGPSCGCPCIERADGPPPYIVTLDYDVFGCVPESGLLPTLLTGHAIVEFDGTDARVTWDGLQFSTDSHGVFGELEGSVSSGAGALPPGELQAQGELTIGPETQKLTLQAQLDEVGLTLDGEVQLAHDEPRPILFEGVKLPYERMGLPCPTPVAGTATQVHERERKSSVVRFGEPGEGTVTVERQDRISQPTDWCGYRSELW